MQLLRHRDRTIAAGSKALLHQKLMALKIVDRLPTPAEEAADPDGADETYQTCGDWLRRKALELKAKAPFDVVHSENIAYGFRRNLLGIRPYGLSVLAFALDTTVAAFLFNRHPYIELSGVVLVGAYLVLGVTPEAVKRAAFDYSQRLLDAAQSLPIGAPNSTQRRRADKPKSTPS